MPPTSLEAAIGRVVRTDRKSPKEKIERAVSHLSRAFEDKVHVVVRKSVYSLVVATVQEALAGRGDAYLPPPLPKLQRQRRHGQPEGALQAGRSFRQSTLATLEERGEIVGSDEAAKRLGMSREALNQQRKAQKVLGLEGTKRGVRYPTWQFEDDVHPVMPRVLRTLRHLDPWGHYLFFTRAEPLLGGMTPLAALRKGQADDVIRVAGLLAAEAAAG